MFLSLALYERPKAGSPVLAQVVTTVGLIWATLVIAIGTLSDLADQTSRAIVEVHRSEPDLDTGLLLENLNELPQSSHEPQPIEACRPDVSRQPMEAIHLPVGRALQLLDRFDEMLRRTPARSLRHAKPEEDRGQGSAGFNVQIARDVSPFVLDFFS